MHTLIAKTKAFGRMALSALGAHRCGARAPGADADRAHPRRHRVRRGDRRGRRDPGSGLGYAYDSDGPGAQNIAEAATAGLLAGRLARKRGMLPPGAAVHGGCLKPVLAMLERAGLPIAQLLPSHVNQTDAYMAARSSGPRGAASSTSAPTAAREQLQPRDPAGQGDQVRLLEAGVPLERVLLSSDGNGAPPKEEQREGQPAVANYMPLGALHATGRRLIVEEGLPPTEALCVVTANVADATGLARRAGSPPAWTPTS